MLKNLIAGIKADEEKDVEKKRGYIEAEVSPNLTRHYATATRWNQYERGEIDLSRLKEYAIERMERQVRREAAKKIEKAERIEEAPELIRISIAVEWSRAHNATATADIYSEDKYEQRVGRAFGYGYDKASSAVASALNESESVLRELYLFKERRLEAGETDKGRWSDRDNRDIIGYGSGYDILPYFEGAVGCECFWRIFDKMGFDVRINTTAKYADIFMIDRGVMV